MAGSVAWELESKTDSAQELDVIKPVRFDIQNARDSFRALLLSSFVLLNFSLFLGVSSLPFFNSVREDLFFAAGALFTVISIAAVIVAGFPLARRVFTQLRAREVTFEALIAGNLVFILALSFQWLASDYEQFSKSLTIEYLITGSMLLFFIQHVRTLLWRRAEWSLWTPATHITKLVSVLDIKSEKTEGSPSVVVTPIEQVKDGAVVRFEAGEIIAFDCTVIDGQALVLERELTFRGVDVQKQTGDALFAGSRVKAGIVTCRVDSMPDEARITSFYPKDDSTVVPSYSSGVVIWFLGLIAFVGIFFTLFWYKQEMLTDMIEPVLGSFLILTLFVEWFAIRRVVPRVQSLILYRAGVILKKPAMLKKVAALARVLMRSDADSPVCAVPVKEIELLDERLDKAGLYSVLFAIYSKVQMAPGSEAIRDYIVSELPTGPTPVSYTDLQYYEGLGIAVNVSGAEFSIGTEDFLIERGVHLSSSEIASESPGVQYVALNDALVALIKVNEASCSLSDVARAAEIRLLLAGDASQEILDKEGKTLGLDLAQVFGSEPLAESIRRLEQSSNSAMLLSNAADAKQLPAVILSVAPFNRLLFEGTLSDVTLVDTSLTECLQAIRRVKLIDRVSSKLDVFIPVATALTAVPIALALISAEVLLAVCALNFGVLYLLSLKQLPLLK